MDPARRNKLNVGKLSKDELEQFRKYGKVPAKAERIKAVPERRFFDSGDYALNKAGREHAPVGVQHPSPENIPHAAPTSTTAATPTKPATASVQRESSLIHDATRELATTDETATTAT